MAGFQDDDEDDKGGKDTDRDGDGAAPSGGMGGGQGREPQFDFQRTFQQPQVPGSLSAGQGSPMPWSRQAPGLAAGGATPWAQGMQPPAAAPGAVPGGAAPGAPGMQPNWQALAQRFGGGGQAPSPAFQGPQGGGPMQGGNGWLQGMLQRAAAQMQQRRAMAQQFAQGRPGQGQAPAPGQGQGFAMPQGVPIPNDRRRY